MAKWIYQILYSATEQESKFFSLHFLSFHKASKHHIRDNYYHKNGFERKKITLIFPIVNNIETIQVQPKFFFFFFCNFAKVCKIL